MRVGRVDSGCATVELTPSRVSRDPSSLPGNLPRVRKGPAGVRGSLFPRGRVPQFLGTNLPFPSRGRTRDLRRPVTPRHMCERSRVVRPRTDVDEGRGGPERVPSVSCALKIYEIH